jgi:thiol:disulfide interchange protein
MKIQTIAIAVLSIAVILLMLKDCDRPSEQKEEDRKKQYETEVAILKVEKASIQKAQDSIGKVLIQRTRKDSIILKAQESKIQALEKKAARQRVVVDTLILNNPDLLSFVDTQNEVISELKVEVDTLKAQNEFQRKLNEQLISMEITEDKIDAAAKIEYEFRIHELEKQAKKEKRKKKLGKLIAVIAGGVGLFLGSQL